MGLHYAHVRPVKQPQTYSFLPDGEPIEDDPPDKFEAYCQCGWQGPLRDARLTAMTDGHRHELHVRPPGAYA